MFVQMKLMDGSEMGRHMELGTREYFKQLTASFSTMVRLNQLIALIQTVTQKVILKP